MEFVKTDLPDPVVPAISICGIFAISATITFPAISIPAAKAILDFCFLNSSDSIRSLKNTDSLFAFGTSIPTAAFPGIGASILISDAARFNFMSSDNDVILLTFVPVSGCNSYLVTDGPLLSLITVAFTPKAFNVC